MKARTKTSASPSFLDGLSAPARRAFDRAGIDSVRKLATFSKAEIAGLHGVGPSTFPTLKKWLAKEGLAFRATTKARATKSASASTYTAKVAKKATSSAKATKIAKPGAKAKAATKEKAAKKKAAAPSMLRKVAFTMFHVKDAKRARGFYEGVLGLTRGLSSPEGTWTEYDLPGGGCLALFKHPDPACAKEPGGASIAFDVADLDAVMKHLTKAGVAFHGGVVHGPRCRMLNVSDSEGNGVILHELATKG
ncbi:MAG: VOC family protein [Polyangiaceae bacterium]